MLKSELRKIIRDRKRQFSQQQLGELSLAVIHRLMAHPRVEQAATILLYYSLPDEVDTHQAVYLLSRRGKRVVLPAVTGEGTMELRLFTGSADLRPGAFGIMEPVGQVVTDYNHIDLAVVPGMAFDGQGHRLGRGKGYYDRLLPRLSHCYKIGMCFDFQKVPSVPTEPTDIAMDEVL